MNILALDRALSELAELNERHAQFVEFRLFQWFEHQGNGGSFAHFARDGIARLEYGKRSVASPVDGRRKPVNRQIIKGQENLSIVYRSNAWRTLGFTRATSEIHKLDQIMK